MASPTQWTWFWVNSGRWWWTGRPDVLQFMGLLSRTWLSAWTELNWKKYFYKELIHTIMETVVSQDLQSELASWRTRRPNDLVLVKKLPDWRPRRSQYSTQIWKQEKSSDPVQFICSIMSNSLQPHGLQYARLPCPSPIPKLTQTHVHWVGNAIQPSHPLSSPSPPAFNLSQHQGLFQWVSFSHQVAKVLEFQFQHQSFQWIFKTDFL